MTMNETAKRLRCSRQWVNVLVLEGRLRAEMIGNRWHIQRSSVSSYERRRDARR